MNRVLFLGSALVGLVLLAGTPACQQVPPPDKRRTPAPTVSLFCNVAQASDDAKQTLKAVPNLGITAHFTPREYMQSGRNKARLLRTPATTLPVDSTGKQTVSIPMDGNDQYGDCGYAMSAHIFNILTYGQGKAGFTEVTVNEQALVQQYLKVEGGDNGCDEDDLVGTNGVLMTGLAGDPTLTVVDHLDFDVTDVALTQYLIDQFYTVQMAWSVPDNFINNFATGTVWANPGIPDPNNGHYTTLADVRADGYYGLDTWGTYCWVSPAFVASVQPQCFVALSARQFDEQGYDSKGRHVTQQAAIWVNLGGNAKIAQALVASFPGGPTPTPLPTPTPAPKPTEPSWVNALIAALPQVLAILAALLGGGASVHCYHLGKRVATTAAVLLCCLALAGQSQACLHLQLAERLHVRPHMVEMHTPQLPRETTPYQRMPQAPDACPDGKCPAGRSILP